jgi:EpsI family protein
MTKNLALYLVLGAAVILLVGTGYVQGVWSERWGTFPELKVFSEQLAAVPREIGEWKGTDAEATDAKILEMAGAEGELRRTYRNENGEEVYISIICGRLQDITYHTPERCYPAAGFDIQNAPQREVIELPGGGDAQFMAANFTKSEPSGTHTERGYWTFTGDGNWTAPDNTKFAFAKHQSALYKLYVFAHVSTEKKSTDRDFCREFIEVFIPTLNEALRPAFERVGRIESGAAPAEAKPAETPPAATPAA